MDALVIGGSLFLPPQRHVLPPFTVFMMVELVATTKPTRPSISAHFAGSGSFAPRAVSPGSERTHLQCVRALAFLTALGFVDCGRLAVHFPVAGT